MEQTCVEEMLDGGQIEPSDSSWASPVVLLTKIDGSTRFCVDYRRLNSLTVKDAYPLPRIDEVQEDQEVVIIFASQSLRLSQ